MDDKAAKPVDAGIEPNFQDMEWMHSGKTQPIREPLGNVDTHRKVVSNPNEADVALQNLDDMNGLR